MRRLLPILLLPATLAAPAQEPDPAQLAAHLGCYNCHGTPPRRDVPSLAELATRYAQYRGQPEAEQQLVDKLRKGTFFSHVAAHERLSDEEAHRLVRWLVAGGR